MDPQLEVAVRALVGLALGAAIGFEREYTRHAAGMRTMALVGAGAAVFAAVGALVVDKGTDPSRIAAQVATGVGFLGAGAIIRDSEGVKGLTTAATVWVVAAIGLAAGFGYLRLATLITAVVLFSLTVVRPIEKRLFRRSQRLGRVTGHDDRAD